MPNNDIGCGCCNFFRNFLRAAVPPPLRGRTVSLWRSRFSAYPMRFNCQICNSCRWSRIRFGRLRRLWRRSYVFHSSVERAWKRPGRLRAQFRNHTSAYIGPVRNKLHRQRAASSASAMCTSSATSSCIPRLL